jgi:hypothetical protein
MKDLCEVKRWCTLKFSFGDRFEQIHQKVDDARILRCFDVYRAFRQLVPGVPFDMDLVEVLRVEFYINHVDCSRTEMVRFHVIWRAGGASESIVCEVKLAVREFRDAQDIARLLFERFEKSVESYADKLARKAQEVRGKIQTH